MKKKLLLAVLLLGGYAAAPAAAQDWGDLLKKAATNAADKLMGGKLTEAALIGTWRYTAPAAKFESDNVLSELGGTAMESTITGNLEKGYAFVGIQPGAASFTFNNDQTFEATLGKAQNLGGTYEFDASTHEITLVFSSGSKFNLGTLNGHVYLSGSELQLVFPVTKLVNVITSIGSKVSSLQTVASLLEKYKEVYIGFAFEK